MQKPFEKSYDVVVAGGGIAGIAAALETSRAGLRTALVEKTIFPGGLATTGLVNIYLPLCDGYGTQVIFGLGEELLLNSMELGPGKPAENWRRKEEEYSSERYRVTFSPAAYILSLDELVTNSGIEVWYDTLVTRPVMNGDTVTGLEVENKSGRGVIGGKCIVDATGDADIAFRAGAECADERNTLSIWSIGTKKPDKPSANPLPMDFLAFPRMRVAEKTYSGINGRDVTDFVLESRKLLREHYRGLHAAGASRHEVFSLTLPAMALFRTTRRIVGTTTLVDNQDGIRFDDSIGLAPDWRKSGPVWEIPAATLFPKRIKGLVTAGRCISSVGDAWEITRVIPTAAVTGQAAGIACILAAKNSTTPETVDAARIQKELKKRGVPYHLDEVGLKYKQS